MKRGICWRRALPLLAMVLALLNASSTAHADAVVVVQVRAAGAPTDGTVTLRAQNGAGTFTCETRAGTCRIEGVPGGSYIATVAPREGAPPPARTVMIAPTGSVSLIISVR